MRLLHSRPGNVRELRNFADRVVPKMPDVGDGDDDVAESLPQRVERSEASIDLDFFRK